MWGGAGTCGTGMDLVEHCGVLKVAMAPPSGPACEADGWWMGDEVDLLTRGVVLSRTIPGVVYVKRTVMSFALGAMLALPASGFAQEAVTGSLKGLHDVTKQNVVATAEMVAEDLYSFQPTEEVRTLGAILAHIANSQYFFCSAAAGVDSPMSENLEETKTTKADIVEAVKGSFEYCDGIYAEMTDEKGAEMRDFFGGMAASAVLAFNSAHNYEHYGNLVTYMRINGITPPSSMPRESP